LIASKWFSDTILAMDTKTESTTNFPFTLTTPALVKAATLARQEGENNFKLRVSVQAGGCSGLRYQLYFDDKVSESDLTVLLKEGENELGIVCDNLSAPYLEGASIDFVDTIEKQGFQIDNPNANGGCACGDSFN
jgi:iron-sulfur cluster assembly accessory protein